MRTTGIKAPGKRRSDGAASGAIDLKLPKVEWDLGRNVPTMVA